MRYIRWWGWIIALAILGLFILSIASGDGFTAYCGDFGTGDCPEP